MQNFKDGIVPVASNKVSALMEYGRTSLKEHYHGEELENILWWIAESFAGIKKHQWISNSDIQVNQSGVILFCNAIDELIKGTPVQYVIGQVEFMGYSLKVNPSVLIPRPETEELVDLVVKENIGHSNLRMLDIGTGSGCIAISLAGRLRNATVVAVDKSTEALSVAKGNADLNHIKGIEWVALDVLTSDYFINQKFDIIVSNPPYISLNEKKQMRPNVINFEPHLALFADEHDPLVFYKRIAQLITICMQSGGRLYLEINENLAEETADIFTKNKSLEIKILNDMFGKPRFIKILHI